MLHSWAVAIHLYSWQSGRDYENCVFNGPYAGRDLHITTFPEKEREFIVTPNANIKPVSYFTGREAELQDLRQRIEAGRKFVLMSGMLNSYNGFKKK